jgi:hypothetical protein
MLLACCGAVALGSLLVTGCQHRRCRRCCEVVCVPCCAESAPIKAPVKQAVTPVVHKEAEPSEMVTLPMGVPMADGGAGQLTGILMLTRAQAAALNIRPGYHPSALIMPISHETTVKPTVDDESKVTPAADDSKKSTTTEVSPAFLPPNDAK